jgi:hypothetical protein
MSFNKRYINSASIKKLYKEQGAEFVYNYIKNPDSIISDNSTLFRKCYNAVNDRDLDKLKKILEQIELN